MNRLPGVIAAVERAGSIAIVDVDALGQRLTASLIGAGQDVVGWNPGMSVTLLFAETEVALAKNLSGLISMRNRIGADVIAIERGSILCRVVLQADGAQLVSIITTRAAHALSLACGDRVEALIKANEMRVIAGSPT
ncbi:MAG: TOBE domain-containing protein [Herminiimonas sp.]|nr:TOBE domain-containing protein [Herminiimonas sp.]